MKSAVLLAVLSLSLSGVASAQFKSEDAIKYRQSAYVTMAWNMARIKASVEGAYNKDDVIKAANVIQAIANSGMGALYQPGTETGKGWEDTRVKPELFTNKEGVGKAAMAFNKEANEMARIAAGGDVAAAKEQFGKLGATCKGCHTDFKIKK
ncbi:MAG: cytochrome c [Pseudomonadota bacterium]|nr:cytochrome c [Pseudomonadota bacterium]